MFDRPSVLVPVDFSESSVRAVRAAVDLLRLTPGRLTLLHVTSVPSVDPEDLSQTAIAAWSTWAAALHARQKEALRKLADEEVPGPMPLELTLKEGDAAEMVLGQIEEGEHDLVFMGTHGRSGLARVWMGSVAEKVLRNSPVPVLVTR